MYHPKIIDSVCSLLHTIKKPLNCIEYASKISLNVEVNVNMDSTGFYERSFSPNKQFIFRLYMDIISSAVVYEVINQK